MWKTLKQIIGGNSNTDSHGGIVHKETKVIANMFSAYFMDSIQDVVRKMSANNVQYSVTE